MIQGRCQKKGKKRKRKNHCSKISQKNQSILQSWPLEQALDWILNSLRSTLWPSQQLLHVIFYYCVMSSLLLTSKSTNLFLLGIWLLILHICLIMSVKSIDKIIFMLQEKSKLSMQGLVQDQRTMSVMFRTIFILLHFSHTSNECMPRPSL